MIDRSDIQNRFQYHAPDENKKMRHTGVRQTLESAAHVINELVPDSVEKGLAIRSLEEAMFWANAAIARYEGGA